MEKNLYQEICELYEYNQETKEISYKITVEDSNLFKELLFKFCFLIREGSLTFKNINDLWFYKITNNPAEIKIYSGIIESLISKSHDHQCDIKQKYVHLVKDYLDNADNDKFTIFKYLQSIYSYMEDNPEYLLFPLFYAVVFDHQIVLENLKRDLKAIINNRLETLGFDDYILYNNINKDFLRYFNKLLNPNEKEIKEIYDYLCDFGKKQLEENEKYNVETFSYFSSIKDLILNYEKKPNDKMEDSGNGLHIKNKNGNSTRNSSEDLNPNTTNINNGKDNNKLPSDNKSKANDNSQMKNKPEDENLKSINISVHIALSSFVLRDLCSKIRNIINNLNINKNSLDKYNELISLNLDNKLLLNKLSSTILILKNANLFNLKRKLVESLDFKILEDYQEFLEFEPKYFPSRANLKDLQAIINELKNKNNLNENEKKKLEDDYKTLDNLIKGPIESNTTSLIKVKDINNFKLKEQLRMSLDFLRFYKKHLHPFVHASGDKINLYLLPKSLFQSDIKYAEYIFTLGDIIKTQEQEEKQENIKEDKKEVKHENKKEVKEEDKKEAKKEKIKEVKHEDIKEVKEKDKKEDIKEVKHEDKKEEKKEDKKEVKQEDIKEDQNKDKKEEKQEEIKDNQKQEKKEEKPENIKEDKTEEKQDREKEKNNLKRDENFSIYKKMKDIKIDEALEILFSEKSVESSYLREIDIDLLKEKKKELDSNLRIFHNYYDSFIQIAPDIKEENFEITETIKKNEPDLFEKLNNYGNLLSKVLNNEIKKVEALNIIDSLKKFVNDEVEDGKLLFEKVLEKIDNINISQIIDSKINRMKLIAYFVKEQSDKFYNYQQAIYKEYEDSCNKIIKRAEMIKETIRYITQEKEDIVEKWIKTSPPFNKRYLKFDVIIDDLKALISSVRIDINYSYNEKFVLWAIKEKFSDYLKY